MILKGFGIKQRHTDSVTENKTVGCCAIVVRGRKALVMKSSRSACCNNDGFCLCNQIIVCFHVQEDCAGNLTFVILDKFNGRGVFENGNLTIYDLISYCSHDFGAGVVFAGVHSLS